MSERRKDFEKKDKPKKPKKIKGDGTDFSGFMAQVRNDVIKGQSDPENGTGQAAEEKIDYTKKADEIRETVGMLEIKVNGDIPDEMSPFAAQIDGLAKAIEESSDDQEMQKALFEKLRELYERIKADNDLLRIKGATAEEKRPDVLTEEPEIEKSAEPESADKPQETAEAGTGEKAENIPDGLVSKENFRKAVERAGVIIAKDEKYLRSDSKEKYKRRREIVWQEIVKLQNEEIADESGAKGEEGVYEEYERMLENYRGEGRKMILEKLLQEMNEDKSENHVLKSRLYEELEKLSSQDKEAGAAVSGKPGIGNGPVLTREEMDAFRDIWRKSDQEKGAIPEEDADLTPEKTEEIIEGIAKSEEVEMDKIDTAKLAQEEARRQFYEESPKERWKYVSGPEDGDAKKAEEELETVLSAHDDLARENAILKGAGGDGETKTGTESENRGPEAKEGWREEIGREIAWLEKLEKAMEKEEKSAEYPGDEKNWAEEIGQEIVNLEKWEKIIEKDEAVLRDILSADKLDEEKEVPGGKRGERKKTEEKNEKKEKDSGISDHVFKRLKILGISPEDAKALKEVGLNKLTEGQQLLVIENLKQLTLGRIQDEAALKYRKNAKEGGQVLGQVKGLKWLSKAWQGFSRHYQIAKLEKKSAKEIIGGGLEAHGAILKQLVAGLHNYGPDVDIIKKSRFRNADELKVRYVSAPETPNTKESEAYSKLNEAAERIGEVPYEYSLPDATLIQKNMYHRAQKKYESALENVLRFKKEELGYNEGVGMLYKNDIDRKVQMNRFFGNDKRIEAKLLRTQSNKWGFLKVMKNVATERGIYMASGYATRAAAGASLAGLAVVVPAAAGMGAFMARARAKKEFKTGDGLGRRGERSEEEKRYAVITREINILNSKMWDDGHLGGGEAKKFTFKENLSDEERRKHEQLTAEKTKLEEAGLGIKFSEAEKIRHKTETLLEKLKDENLDDKKRGIYKKSLRLNIDWIDDKTSKGLIDFGTWEKRVTGQHDLVRSLAQGEIALNGYKLGDKWAERFDRAISERDSKTEQGRKKVIRKRMAWGAGMAAGFAGAGWLVRHFWGDQISDYVGRKTGPIAGKIGEGLEKVKEYVGRQASGGGEPPIVPPAGGIETVPDELGKMGAIPDSGASQADIAPDEPPVSPPEGPVEPPVNSSETPLPGTVPEGDEYRGLITGENSRKAQFELATVRKGDGVTHVLKRQLTGGNIKDPGFLPNEEQLRGFGYEGDIEDRAGIEKWADRRAFEIARDNDYVGADETETRIGTKGIGRAAYVLEKDANGEMGIHEYLKNEKGEFISQETGKTQSYEYLKERKIIEAEKEISAIKGDIETAAKIDQELNKFNEFSKSYGLSLEDARKTGIDIHDQDGFSPADRELLEFWMKHKNYYPEEIKLIRELSLSSGIDYRQEFFIDAYDSMPNAIKGNYDSALGYMKIFAGNREMTGQGLKELLRMDHAPSWETRADNTIIVRDVFGRGGFNILMTEDKIGVDGPSKLNWGTKGGLFTKIRPVMDMSPDNIATARAKVESFWNIDHPDMELSSDGSTREVPSAEGGIREVPSDKPQIREVPGNESRIREVPSDEQVRKLSPSERRRMEASGRGRIREVPGGKTEEREVPR
ncbi:hypothetical protein A2303_02925 [Candidatus Falkowbacteria bacterium RIFOXYB2_FULL_47_14]|uniref:Uncharacterized protein n=1 Tax=Candidatus Falkowbacteria bacterium RIFOXYA2_FULL_47_19 TaxID=1797994 RepID=A0A1F5SM37_9BACT|nr:MAG: hypothetical protein A2227_02000 [Candidatus Falkowbacteria bacterium RIFOXYA2_FULL_47_19]OGF36269.1 MAG: hypothetical protein A2468_07670 [Candidatus Falkowbacteria bacterium RIFOXYC2_FULL_46_15]OGF43073.1 MAG: hypothetical protein A2303_02925 [Candidatus Falkowbacteria bacterium RIFOXYB2_FULL_47_14]